MSDDRDYARRQLRDDLLLVGRAIQGADLFLSRRDEMNAAVHEAGVRYSPLTLSMREAWSAYARLDAELRRRGGQ